MLPSCIPGTDEWLRRAACADRTLWSTSPERQGPLASGRLLFRGAVSCCCRRERTVQSKKTKSFRWLVCTQTKTKFGLRLRTVACVRIMCASPSKCYDTQSTTIKNLFPRELRILVPFSGREGCPWVSVRIASTSYG